MECDGVCKEMKQVEEEVSDDNTDQEFESDNESAANEPSNSISPNPGPSSANDDICNVQGTRQRLGRRGAVVKGLEHISTIMLVNI